MSCSSPGVALMTSSWYVKDELPFRMAVWHGAQTLSNVFGGPLAAGILETMDGLAGLHAWKWCKYSGLIKLGTPALEPDLRSRPQSS